MLSVKLKQLNKEIQTDENFEINIVTFVSLCVSFQDDSQQKWN